MATTHPSPWQGKLIDDRYHVGSQLGSGAMAWVHSAVDQRLDREVAVKILRTDREMDESIAKRLYREAKSAARVTHPGTIAIYDVGYHDDVVFVVMELLRGRPLDELLKAEGKLPFPFVMDAGRQAAEALMAIHKAGIIHRDIKPENMFVCDSSSGALIKLLDFSIAKLSEELETQQLTIEGAILGSAYYMSPEQVHAQPVSPQTDLYALGAVLFECISGRPPFDAPTLVDLWTKHVIEPPPRLHDELPEVPVALSNLIVQMLAKAPEERPTSAAEVAYNLAKQMDITLLERSQPQPGRRSMTQTSKYKARSMHEANTRLVPAAEATTANTRK